MQRYTYQWSEDGVAELVWPQDTHTEEETLCYHCGTLIRKGCPVTKLTTDGGEVYILHRKCAKAGLNAVNYMGWDEPANLMRKAEILRQYISDLKYLQTYYTPIFNHDPWVQEQIDKAEAEFAALDQKYRKRMKGVVGPNGKTGEEMGVTLHGDEVGEA